MRLSEAFTWAQFGGLVGLAFLPSLFYFQFVLVILRSLEKKNDGHWSHAHQHSTAQHGLESEALHVMGMLVGGQKRVFGYGRVFFKTLVSVYGVSRLVWFLIWTLGGNTGGVLSLA